MKFPKHLYTGYSEDLKKRINEHDNGRCFHTNKFKPWKLIYYAAFENKIQATRFEKYLKTASGIAFRNKRLIS